MDWIPLFTKGKKFGACTSTYEQLFRVFSSSQKASNDVLFLFQVVHIWYLFELIPFSTIIQSKAKFATLDLNGVVDDINTRIVKLQEGIRRKNGFGFGGAFPTGPHFQTLRNILSGTRARLTGFVHGATGRREEKMVTVTGANHPFTSFTTIVSLPTNGDCSTREGQDFFGDVVKFVLEVDVITAIFSEKNGLGGSFGAAITRIEAQNRGKLHAHMAHSYPRLVKIASLTHAELKKLSFAFCCCTSIWSKFSDFSNQTRVHLPNEACFYGKPWVAPAIAGECDQNLFQVRYCRF